MRILFKIFLMVISVSVTNIVCEPSESLKKGKNFQFFYFILQVITRYNDKVFGSSIYFYFPCNTKIIFFFSYSGKDW